MFQKACLLLMAWLIQEDLKMTNKYEVEQLLKQIKEYRNDMVARNYPHQQISDIITKWENRNVKTISEESQEELEPITSPMSDEQNLYNYICNFRIHGIVIFVYAGGGTMTNKYYINYFSKSDCKNIKRPYDPHSEMQHEFIAGSGNLCKRYWDESKEGLRTANAPWTITVRK